NPIKPGFYLVIVTHCRVCPSKVLLHFPFKFTPHIALRARRKRPRARRAAEQGDELAALHVCSRSPRIARYHTIVGNAALGLTENLGGKSTLCREIALVSLAARVAAVPGER